MPQLDEGAEVLMLAYAELSTCKALGPSGLGPVPATAVWQWCDRLGLDAGAAEHAAAVLRAVDGEYIRRQASEAALRRKHPERPD